MKKLTTIAIWLTVIFSIITGAIWTTAYDSKQKSEDCEGRIADELNTSVTYIDDQCMGKGYGRFDGR